MSSAKRPCPDGIVGRRLTRGSAPSSFDDGLRCSKCLKSILFLVECARLSPCSCTICLKRLAALHGRRGSQPLRCCHLKVSDHQVIGAEQIPTDETVVYTNVDSKMTEEEMGMERSFEYLLREEFNRLDSTIGDGMIGVLYCRMVERVDGNFTCIHNSTHLHCLYSEHASPDYSNSIAKFFSFLYPYIISPSVTSYSDMVIMAPHEFWMHAVQNFSPLMAVLHRLATGEPFPAFHKITGKDYIRKCSLTDCNQYSVPL